MTKRLLTLLLSLTLVIGLIPVTALAEGETNTWTGSGTEADPYVIDTVEELKQLATNVNGGETYTGKYFVLGADLDLNNEAWTPIGNGTKKFNGNFDGKNYKISNLYVSQTDNYAGLFGRVGSDSEYNNSVSNLTLENVNVTGGNYTAALIGNSYVANVTNCYVTGDVYVKGSRYTGVITGALYGKVDSCTVTDTTQDGGLVTAAFQVGGAVGFLGEGTGTYVKNCTVQNMTVKATTGGYIGGVVGVAQYGNTISGNTISSVTVDAGTYADYANENYSGLIVGQNYSTSYSTNGNAYPANYVINNTVTDSTGTLADGTTITKHSGYHADWTNTVIGSEVEFNEAGEITDGTFEVAPPASVLAEGLEPVKNSDGSYGLVMAAKVGDKEYGSLQEAIDAAQSGDTITLLRDITVSDDSKTSGYYFTVGPQDDITLNLNGHTISGTINASGNCGLIDVQGKLNVTGTGTIELTNTDYSTAWAFTSAVIGLNNHNGYTVDTALTLEEGVIIQHNGGTCMAYGVDMMTYTGCSVTINGATVKSAYTGVRIFGNNGNKILTINSGTITAVNRGVWVQHTGTSDADVVVNGGTIDADKGIHVSTAAASTSPVDVTLKGGSISSLSLALADDATTEPTITKEDAVTLAAPEGYIWDVETNKLREFNETTDYCKLSYDLNGATGTGYDAKTCVLGESVTVLAAPSRSGYTFRGWLANGTTYQPGDSLKMIADVTLVAQWTKNPIFIPSTPSEPEITEPEVTVDGTTATVTLPEGTESAVVTIPYANAEGMVVRNAETKEIIPFCVVTEEGIKVLVNGDVTLEIVNNDRNFTDVADHWAEPFIDFVTERELYDGMTATTFGPDETMTQAMLIVVLAGMDGNEASGNDWYTWAVNWGIENDIFTVTDTTTEMSREDFALMLFNYAKKLGLDTTIRADLSTFPDADEISTANLTAMQWAVAAGLMEGRTDGTIDPTAGATRAEVAVMLMNFIIFTVS